MVGIIVPLWRRLTRIAGRFERAVLRPAKVRAARPRPGPGGNATAVALPNGRGWLVRELGYEAAGFGSQLAHFLAEPEMQALIAAVPGVGLVLRPVCRMLGYELATVTQMVPPLAVDAGIVPLSPGAGSAQAPPVLPSVSVTDNGVVLVGITGNCSDFATSA